MEARAGTGAGPVELLRRSRLKDSDSSVFCLKQGRQIKLFWWTEHLVYKVHKEKKRKEKTAVLLQSSVMFNSHVLGKHAHTNTHIKGQSKETLQTLKELLLFHPSRCPSIRYPLNRFFFMLHS